MTTTIDQPLFDVAPLVAPDHEPEATIQERFDAWIDANAWVLTAVESLIAEWLNAGHSKVGVKAAWEVIRWNYGVTIGDPFKANNDYTSRVARLVIQRHPEWAESIETRQLRAA